MNPEGEFVCTCGSGDGAGLSCICTEEEKRARNQRERTRPFLRDRRAGDPCDRQGCEENKTLIRVNGKGKPGIFMCIRHAEEVQALHVGDTDGE